MRSAWLSGTRDIGVREVPEPVLIDPTDVIVDISYAGICGSDLWVYRGIVPREPGSTGHEFIGRVSEAGSEVTELSPGDSVIAPFIYSDGGCTECRRGLQPYCARAGLWGRDTPGAQAERIRVPFAEATLVRLPWSAEELTSDLVRALMPLADVFATGTHGAVLAGVGEGDVVAIVGDGAVGISAAIASSRLGAERVILFGEQERRLAIAAGHGVETVRVDRDEPVGDRLRALNHGTLADRVIECVGLQSAFDTALQLVRPGGAMGFVGVPHGVDPLPPARIFAAQIQLTGGIAPARRYLPEFVADTYAQRLDVSSLIDTELPLSEVAAGYDAMDTAASLKVVLKVTD